VSLVVWFLPCGLLFVGVGELRVMRRAALYTAAYILTLLVVSSYIDEALGLLLETPVGSVVERWWS
jgi:hypothetical protein